MTKFDRCLFSYSVGLALAAIPFALLALASGITGQPGTISIELEGSTTDAVCGLVALAGIYVYLSNTVRVGGSN
jgi:uncharacterized membrane protein YozB (DUF420 family)